MGNELSLDEEAALRRVLSHLDSVAPLSPELPEYAEVQRQNQRRWSPALVVTVAFVLVLVVVAPIALLVQKDSGDSAAPTTVNPVATSTPSTPTPTTEASPATTTSTPTSTVPVVVPPPETMWERIVDESFAPGAIWAIASTDEAIVAVGEMSGPTDTSFVPGSPVDGGSRPRTEQDDYPNAVVWVSADGRSWDRIDDEAVFGGEGAQILWSVVSGPLGLVASGQDGADAALWFSPDGSEWEKVLVDDLGRPREVDSFAVAAGGPGWIAIDDDDDPGEVVFVSPDGFEWARIDDQVAAREYVGVVEASDGPAPITVPPLLGVFWDFAWDGERVIGVCRFNGVSIWLSEDSGATWYRVDPEQEVFEGGWPLPQSLGVTLFGSEIVVGGNAQDSAAIWVGTWEEGD